MTRNAIDKARDTLGKLDGLSHIVQCEDRSAKHGRGWRTIAAFNVGVIARKYAADNRRAAKAQNFAFHYRVRLI